MNPLLLTDFYKVHHNKMYPEGTTMIYSNFTPRKSRIPGIDKVVFFGLQHFILEYLIKSFNEEFFGTEYFSRERLDKIGKGFPEKLKKARIEKYSKHIQVDTKHIEDLWDLGYLPIEIKALSEGVLIPIGVPCFTIKNTHPDFAWLTNYLETLISCMMWQPITSATIAYEYKKLLTKYALETTGSSDFVQWQGHDFSFRGMSSVESAILSGMGHLLSFTGTDTIPAIYQLEKSYFADGLIGASVPATEHSIMSMGVKENEITTFRRLLNLYPTGILSVVSDTWDLWKVLTEYLPAIKEQILSRDGKLVIRPDSGDPVDILCGTWQPRENARTTVSRNIDFGGDVRPEHIGVIELLWNLFGGTLVTGNDGKQYKQLDPHIGAIYGDSITLDRARDICERLKAKGFASTNIVLGIGSYTYQYNTRDTFGFAMKATYGEVKTSCTCNKGEGCSNCKSVGREIFKDPITDDGTKKSKKGLLQVTCDGLKKEGESCSKNDNCKYPDCILIVKDQCTWEQESQGLLETIFLNGKLVKTVTLQEIRDRLKV